MTEYCEPYKQVLKWLGILLFDQLIQFGHLIHKLTNIANFCKFSKIFAQKKYIITFVLQNTVGFLF